MIMRNIIVYEFNGERFLRTITAKKGMWVAGTWKLENGTIYNYHEGEESAYEISFATLDIILKEDLQNILKNRRTPQEMSSKELRQQIDILQ